MAKHKHEKHVHCEHAEVAFCGPCDVAYCKNCKQEWGECRLNHSPYWYYAMPHDPITVGPGIISTTSGTEWGTAAIDHSNTTYTAAHAAHTN